MNRAYSILEVKSTSDDDGERIIRGTATTPSPDRVGDIVEPLGVSFRNSMPLLWQHKSDKPVGTVTFDKPTKNGITFVAKLAKVTEPGALKDRIDEAWQSVKHGLVSAVSIGFRGLEYAFMDDGGIRFIRSEVLELSLVTIPANADATISSIKSIDTEIRAATGIKDGEDRPVPPGDTGKSKTVKLVLPKEGKSMKTIAEQIAAFEATRAAKAAELETIMTTTEGETLDKDAGESADTLVAEIKSIDDHVKRLRIVESVKASSAKPVKGETEKEAVETRSSIQVKAPEKHAPGIQFARMVKCLAIGHKVNRDPLLVAKEIYGDQGNQEVVDAVKAVVVAQSTTAAATGGNLIIAGGGVFADFVEFLRPMTIIGKFGTGNVPSLRNVPFRVALGSTTTGGTAAWVGEGKAKPLTNFQFGQTTLLPLKVAAITVATMELLRDASAPAEAMLRDLLAAAVAERIDIDFINPAKTAVAGVSPASITNGVTPIASSGNDAAAIRADFQALMATFLANDNPPSSAVWVMPTLTALSISLMQNPLGQNEFPGIGMTGGTLLGLPAIVSDYATTDSGGANVALVNARDIWLGDEGGIEVRASNEASLQMDDTPTQSSVASVTATSVVSMFQTNSVALLAERTINWAKRRADAVAMLSDVNWGAEGS